MKKQTDQQQETHGKTTNHISNKDKQQTNNKTLLRLKAGMKEKYVYKAVKHMSRATSFAVNFLPTCIVCKPSV